MSAVEIEKTDPTIFAFWLRFWRRVIAVVEIIGGLCGIFIVAFGRLEEGTGRVILLLAFTLFVAAVWGGILLLLGRRGGVTVSLVLQALQLVQVVTAGVVYSFTCGVQVLLGPLQTEQGTDLGFGFTAPAGFSVFLNPPPGVIPASAMTGLNVVAALSIICLLYVRAAERRAAVPPKPAEDGASEPVGVWPPPPMKSPPRPR